VDYVAWKPQPRTVAAGGGKSDFSLGDALTRAEAYGASFHGVLFRRTYPELEEIISRTLELYQRLGTYKADAKTWTFHPRDMVEE
jgi:hypothetical protein